MSDTTTILSYVAIGTSVLGAIYTAVNHRRIRSTCCGFKGEASLDIGELTPERPTEKSLPLVDASSPCRSDIPAVRLNLPEDSAVSK